MDTAPIKKILSRLMSRYPVIGGAYLFGSFAHGKARPDSDVDIAIRLTLDLSPEASFDLRLELMDALEEVFHRPVDVVILNNASLKMIRQVTTKGELLYAHDRNKEQDYAIQKQKEYFDFKLYIDRNSKELKSFFGAV